MIIYTIINSLLNVYVSSRGVKCINSRGFASMFLLKFVVSKKKSRLYKSVTFKILYL